MMNSTASVSRNIRVSPLPTDAAKGFFRKIARALKGLFAINEKNPMNLDNAHAARLWL